MLRIEHPLQSLPSLNNVLLSIGLVGGFDGFVTEEFLSEFGILRVEVTPQSTPAAVWLEILPVDIYVSRVTETLHQGSGSILRECWWRNPVFAEDLHRRQGRQRRFDVVRVLPLGLEALFNGLRERSM